MSNLALNLEDMDAFLDLESPYMYADEYLDTANSSESTSPIMSSVRTPLSSITFALPHPAQVPR